MAVDWSIFGIDLLSGAIILILGWIIAEVVIYRFQRKRAKRNLVNKMIDELSEVRTLFREIYNKWFEVKKRPSYKNRLEKKEEDVQEINNKIQLYQEIQFEVFSKLKNSLPEWKTKKVKYSMLLKGEESEIEFNLSDIIKRAANLTKLIQESISSGDVSREMSAIILKKFQITHLCFSIIIVELIA